MAVVKVAEAKLQIASKLEEAFKDLKFPDSNRAYQIDNAKPTIPAGGAPGRSPDPGVQEKADALGEKIAEIQERLLSEKNPFRIEALQKQMVPFARDLTFLVKHRHASYPECLKRYKLEDAEKDKEKCVGAEKAQPAKPETPAAKPEKTTEQKAEKPKTPHDELKDARIVEAALDGELKSLEKLIPDCGKKIEDLQALIKKYPSGTPPQVQMQIELNKLNKEETELLEAEVQIRKDYVIAQQTVKVAQAKVAILKESKKGGDVTKLLSTLEEEVKKLELLKNPPKEKEESPKEKPKTY